MKKLGFGLMRLPTLDPNDSSKIDLEQVNSMVDAYIEQGFTYFDTAWMYCKFESENATKKTLVTRHPRNTYTLATKLHAGYLKCAEDRDRIFEEQRRKTGAEYFDYYLLHSINRELYEKYNQYDCFAWLAEKKKQGLVRHMGFSFHDDAEFLDKVLTEHPEFEFVQLQINYLDWESESIQSRKCYEVARKHNMPIIVMEPVRGGALANVPQSVEKLFRSHDPKMSVASWAVRYAASLDGVFMVLSGMSNMEQLMDNMSYMKEFTPLTKEENEKALLAADLINGAISIPCTACQYCTTDCPMNIAIPEYFSLYNQQKGDEKSTDAVAAYNALTAERGRASDCIGCGQCEEKCPQHIEIMNWLQEVGNRFED